MKLSNLSVIFIVIAIPLVLILSYYISLQRDTINMQTAYNTKLLDSTKEAIEAFEINTVEWNEAYSETADSKRRDIMASINTFTTSLANNLGVSGTSKEYLLAHIPAIAFTLYDGCYIYSPSETKFTVKNEDGVTQFMSKDLADDIGYTAYTVDNDGKILYQAAQNPVGTYNGQPFTLNPDDAVTTKQQGSQDYPPILKPFTAYSESVTSESNGNKMVINYTLDNYVTIYGDFGDGEGYVSHSGYLNVIGENIENAVYVPNNNFDYGLSFLNASVGDSEISSKNPITGIKFSGREIKPELLSETIAYKDGSGDINKASFNYVYEAEKDTKVYYDGSRFFRLGNDLKRVYVEDLPEPLYKKCTIPTKISGKNSYLKVYQSLEDGQWYIKNGNVYILVSDGDLSKKWDELFYHSGYFNNICFDYSAINYCVETYVFTNLINELNLKDSDGNIIIIEEDNDPEKDESEFTQHKRKVIRGVIESNLNQAITSYSRNVADEYRLPILKETEWDQVLSNVSIITFLQNIPIGLKYYNNYAIATSTFNKEYVDPDEIYIYDQSDASDLIYHSPYCDKLTTTSTSDLIGYRSIDYMYKNYEVNNAGNKATNYYFKHTNKDGSSVNQSCYYCLVQRALYKEDITDSKKDAYYTALARERYLQLDSITIEKADISVTKKVNPIDVEYGKPVEYTIEITNNGSVNDYINIVDYYYPHEIEIDDSSFSYATTGSSNIITKTKNTSSTLEGYETQYWQGITIDPGETITIKYNATITGDIGADIINKVQIRTYFSTETVIAETISQSKIYKKVLATSSASANPNVILVLDDSASMFGSAKQRVKEATRSLISTFEENGIPYSIVGFASFAKELDDISEYGSIVTGITTSYNSALTEAKRNNFYKDDKANYLIFMSDGSPTFEYVPVGFADKLSEIENRIQEIEESNPLYWLNPIWTFCKVEKVALEFIKSIIDPISGGWLECIWQDENTYAYNLMITGSLTVPDILSRLGFDGNPSKYTWDIIMDKINKWDNGDEEKERIYTVYYNTSNSNSPIYGLKRMSSVDESGNHLFYNANASDTTTNQLQKVFEEIAKNITGVDISGYDDKSYGTIQLEQVSKIKSIRVGANEYNFDTYFTGIAGDSEDKAELNLNDYPTIFHQEGEITIVY